MKQRVLIFSTAYFPLVGGAEVALKEVTDRIPDFEFDLICARIKKGLVDTEKIGNVTVHRCGFGHPIDKYFLPILALFRSAKIDRDYWSRNPDYQPPTTNHRLIWSLMASYGGFAALMYVWLHPTSKMLLTIQEGDPLEHYAKRAGRLQWLHRAIFKRADSVQAISRFLADWSVKMGFKGMPEVIPNGVDIEKFSRRISPDERRGIRERFGFSESDFIIVTASRLSLKNAVDDLIRALMHLPESYKAFILGEGEDESLLRNLVKESGLELRVVFAGRKTHDELPALLQSSDVFVRASLSEGLGNAFLEAMAAGIPVIGTRVGGIPDFLKDGETGLFCETRNPVSIAEAVRHVREESDLQERLAKNGVKLVRERYDWNQVAERMESLLHSIAH